jgi:predicted DNA-binding transcriptional regulator AlpA
MAHEDELLGVTEIAQLFEVANNTAWRWSKRQSFPEPAARLSAGPVWRRADVEAWGKEYLPLRTGRPPKT